MNAKAQALLDKIKQQNENVAAIQQYWTSLFPDFSVPSTITTLAWLQRYDFETVVAGLDAAVIQASKRLEDEPMTAEQAISYASATMRDKHRETLSPEEQERRKHSKTRSEAGKKGAQARWKNKDASDNKAETANLPSNVMSLPSDAKALSPAYACSNVYAPALATAHATAVEHASKPTAATPPVTLAPLAAARTAIQSLKENLEPRTETGVSKFPPNKKTKQAPDGAAYPQGFDSWSNADRLEWLAGHGLPGAVSRSTRQEIEDELDAAGTEPERYEPPLPPLAAAQKLRDSLCSGHSKPFWMAYAKEDRDKLREIMDDIEHCTNCQRGIAEARAADVARAKIKAKAADLAGQP